MRVLILRPEPQASAMAGVLASAGIAATVAPMLRVVPEAGVAAAVLASGDASALVFTSAAGVAALASDRAVAGLRHLPVVAVGPATAGAARDAGFADVTSADGDGAAAAGVVLRIPQTGGTVVHVAGRDMAFDVADALVKAGRAARTVTAYRSEPVEDLAPDVAADLGGRRFAAVVVASARTAEAFGRCLERAGFDRLPATTLVAISAKASAPLRPFFDRLVVAEAPDGESLTKAVVALARAA